MNSEHNTPRKICVITGTRAEYGLLRWVMEGLRSEEGVELQIIVTGMHLSHEFGLTYMELEKDGFKIDRKLELLLSSDTTVGLAKSMGLGLIGFGEIYSDLNPDLILVLGDRFEIFAAAAAAMVSRIPIAHLHGGEATEGVIDESIRHSISKMSHLHFVAAEEYRNRVIQLGEQPERVYLVGGLGIDNINKLNLLERSDLEKSLEFELGKKNLLVTFHPVTLENATSAQQMTELLSALKLLTDTQLILTKPNADTGGRVLIDLLEEFAESHSNAKVYTSLGQLRYLSCIKHVDGVVGNSSSGLIEVPSFKKGTVNIGDRQRGRLRAESIIDCVPEKNAIVSAIKQLYNPDFQIRLKSVRNPYGEGGASQLVVDKIKNIPLDGIIKKRFYDL